jgi:hypothetical protein
MSHPANDGLITLTADEILQYAKDALLEHVQVYINGRKCTLENVYDLILEAAAQHTTLNDVCDNTPGAPTGTTVLGHLHKGLPHDLGHLWHLEAKLNRALIGHLPPKVYRVRSEMAIDLVMVPYYGEPAQKADEIRRSVARDGTTHFHCYATAYLIYRDRRLTLALTFVRKRDSMVAILRRLFKRLDVLNLRIKRLYLDKGFYSVAVIQWLKERELPFILPVRMPAKGGVRALCVGRKSHRATYTLHNQKLGKETVDLALVRKYSKKRHRRRGSRWFAYVTYQVNTDPKRIFQFYRRRFGIESSYREMHQMRARTTSPNPALRLLYVGIAFLLVNLWVWLKLRFGADVHRGKQRLHPRRLTLKRLCHMLCRAIKKKRRGFDTLAIPAAEFRPLI